MGTLMPIPREWNVENNGVVDKGVKRPMSKMKMLSVRNCHASTSNFERPRDGDVKTMRLLLRTTAAGAMFFATFAFCLALAQGSLCYAQDQDQPQAPTQTKMAKVHEPRGPSSESSTDAPTASVSPAQPEAAPVQALPAEVANELKAMKARI